MHTYARRRTDLDRRLADGLCAYRSCDDPITATVLVGADRLPVCFTHEREYADRYGSEDIFAIIPEQDA